MGGGTRTTVTAFRGAVLLLCAVLATVAEERTYAALPVALLALLALLDGRLRWLEQHPVVTGLAEAVVASGCVVLTGGADSPMLPYQLVPPAVVALRAGAAAVALVSAVSAAVLGAAAVVADDPPTRLLQWSLLGLALGLLATRARALSVAAAADDEPRYAEVRALLEQLRAVSRRLPGGLDVTTTAETLLTRCAAAGGPEHARSAVLLQPSPGALVPVAVLGTRRVPWRAPLSEPGPLRRAWESLTPVVDRRVPDSHGRRKGSTLVVLPLHDGTRPFGLVVLEAFSPDAFDDACQAELTAITDELALPLEAALLFDELKGAASTAERDRLAKEMHDGVAQDLAFVGYQLDDLRRRAAAVDADLAEQVGSLRSHLSSLVSDLRLSITDLKTSVSPDRGLGSAVSSYVRAVGTGGALAVHLTLDESAFRLPGDQEALLLQVLHVVAGDARRTGAAKNLWVRLDVDPPAARLTVEHDGPEHHVEELDAFRDALTRTGGSLRVRARQTAGVRVDAVLGGGSDGDDRHARR
jgi:signal transduction histidine kinase